MGMFDHLELVGANDPVLCYEGHECRSLQTKDLECFMDHYYVFERCLYKLTDGDEYEHVPFDRGLEVIHKRQALPVSLGPKAEVRAYTTCEACDPVFVVQRGWPKFRGDENSQSLHQLLPVYPWVEYRFEFNGGLLEACEPVQVETREDLRASHGHQVLLGDDDQITKREIKRLRAKKLF